MTFMCRKRSKAVEPVLHFSEFRNIMSHSTWANICSLRKTKTTATSIICVLDFLEPFSVAAQSLKFEVSATHGPLWRRSGYISPEPYFVRVLRPFMSLKQSKLPKLSATSLISLLNFNEIYGVTGSCAHWISELFNNSSPASIWSAIHHERSPLGWKGISLKTSVLYLVFKALFQLRLMFKRYDSYSLIFSLQLTLIRYSMCSTWSTELFNYSAKKFISRSQNTHLYDYVSSRLGKPKSLVISYLHL